MRLLLDTHALLWLLQDDHRLGSEARAAILDRGNDVFVSIVTFWEIAVKVRVGKLGPLDIEAVIATVTAHGLELLALEPRHIAALAGLPLFPDHRDPFDHQLIAQAIAENLTFMTEDRNAPRYKATVMACSA